MKTLENEAEKQVLRSRFRDDPNPNFRVRSLTSGRRIAQERVATVGPGVAREKGRDLRNCTRSRASRAPNSERHSGRRACLCRCCGSRDTIAMREGP
jgi:hypothetical protein